MEWLTILLAAIEVLLPIIQDCMDGGSDGEKMVAFAEKRPRIAQFLIARQFRKVERQKWRESRKSAKKVMEAFRAAVKDDRDELVELANQCCAELRGDDD